MSEFDCDVAIVGAGPVGSALAILLGQLGRSVVVLERWPELYPLPRAVHFDHEVGRILQSCGIGVALRAVSEPADIYEWRNGAGRTLLRFGRSGNGSSGWPYSSMVNQPALEGLLASRLASLPSIVIRRGESVEGLSGGPDGVVLSTAGGGTVRARWAVGCDGANSTVRELAGLAMHDLGYFFDWLVVDVILNEPRVFDPVNLQVCDPARPTTAVSGGPGRRRWEFMRLPEESVESLNVEARAWELLTPWDVHPGNARLERHAVYTFGARYASAWRAGRVLIAGDAAHLMPPFAGQGMCSGLRDSANLAWKLDMVLSGMAPESLLDTYPEERLPSVRAAIEFSMELGRVICVPDPVEAAQRDELMAAVVGPEPSEVPPLPGIAAGLVHAGSPLAGELFIQPEVEGGLLDDVHGVGWRLVTGDGPDGVDAQWFETIGGQVVQAKSSWFEDHEVEWALARPDFHLYGTATSSAEASELLARLRSQIGAA